MVRPCQFVQRDLWGNPIEGSPAPPTTVMPLDFERFVVRILLIRGEPWWVLADVARVLGFRDAANAGRVLKDKHKGTHPVSTLGGTQETTIINESGLYRLIMRSNKPESERFQDWVTEEVLPEIRKTGAYASRGGRVAREARRLKTNGETARARCDQFTLNKLANRELADEGACPNDFAAIHNAVYRGQFESDAPALRNKLGQRPWETPLDRMGLIPLVANAHAKAIGFEKIHGLGGNLPRSAKVEILETTAREMTAADMQRLGPGYYVGLKEDPKRGKIIDVMRNELARSEETA